MKVCGIDPGIANTGVVAMHCEKGQFEVVHWEHIRTRSNQNVGVRLVEIHQQLEKFLKTYSPDMVCYETVFFGENISSAIPTAKVIGIVEFLCTQENHFCTSVSPSQVKQVTGLMGKVSKARMGTLATEVFALSLKASHHVVDAAFIAKVGYEQLLKRNPNFVFHEWGQQA